MRNGVLPLNNKILNHLKLKQPQPKKVDKNTLLTNIPEKIHAVKFESIDAELDKKAATKTKERGSGPSGINADGWRHILLSNRFIESFSDLWQILAKIAKKLSVEDKYAPVEAFLDGQLISFARTLA